MARVHLVLATFDGCCIDQNLLRINFMPTSSRQDIFASIEHCVHVRWTLTANDASSAKTMQICHKYALPQIHHSHQQMCNSILNIEIHRTNSKKNNLLCTNSVFFYLSWQHFLVTISGNLKKIVSLIFVCYFKV